MPSIVDEFKVFTQSGKASGGSSIADEFKAFVSDNEPTPTGKVLGYTTVGTLSKAPIHYGTHGESGTFDITANEVHRHGKDLATVANELRAKGYIVAERRKGQRGIESDHLHIADPERSPKEAARLTKQGWANKGQSVASSWTGAVQGVSQKPAVEPKTLNAKQALAHIAKSAPVSNTAQFVAEINRKMGTRARQIRQGSVPADEEQQRAAETLAMLETAAALPTREGAGFPERAATDAIRLANGMAMLPVALGNVGKLAVTDPKAAGQAVSAMGTGVVQQIGKHLRHPISSFSEEPLSTVMDWTMVFDAAAGLSKLGSIGAARAGTVTRGQQLLVKAAKLGEAGKIADAEATLARARTLLTKDSTVMDAISKGLDKTSGALHAVVSPKEWVGGARALRTKAQEVIAKEAPGWKSRFAQKGAAKPQPMTRGDAARLIVKNNPDLGMSMKAVADEIGKRLKDGRMTVVGVKDISGSTVRLVNPDEFEGLIADLAKRKRVVPVEVKTPTVAAVDNTAPIVERELTPVVEESVAGSTPTIARGDFHIDTETGKTTRLGAEPKVADAPVDSAVVKTAVVDAVKAGARTPEDILSAVRQSVPEAGPQHVSAQLTVAEMGGDVAKTATGYEAVGEANPVAANAMPTATMETGTLPEHLRGAKPRFGYGSKLFNLDFADDVDKAAFIVRNAAKKSKADAKYLEFLQSRFPIATEAELRAMGQTVAERIKPMAGAAEKGGMLKVERVLGVEARPIAQEPTSGATSVVEKPQGPGEAVTGALEAAERAKKQASREPIPEPVAVVRESRAVQTEGAAKQPWEMNKAEVSKLAGNIRNNPDTRAMYAEPDVYYHVADESYRPGDDILSVEAQWDKGIEPRNKWAEDNNGEWPDTGTVSLFDNYPEALDFYNEFGGQIMRVEPGPYGWDYAPHKNAEGYPSIVGKIDHHQTSITRVNPEDLAAKYAPKEVTPDDPMPKQTEEVVATAEASTGSASPLKKKSADIQDAFLGDLSNHTDRIFTETSPSGALDNILGNNGDPGEIWFSNNPDTALGQGGNKGVVIEMDAQGLQGQLSRRKPGWDFAYDNGSAEFIAKYNNVRDYKQRVRSITIKPDAVGSKSERIRLKRFVDDWETTKNADGSVTYTKPQAEEVAKPYNPSAVKMAEGEFVIDADAAPTNPLEPGSEGTFTQPYNATPTALNAKIRGKEGQRAIEGGLFGEAQRSIFENPESGKISIDLKTGAENVKLGIAKSIETLGSAGDAVLRIPIVKKGLDVAGVQGVFLSPADRLDHTHLVTVRSGAMGVSQHINTVAESLVNNGADLIDQMAKWAKTHADPALPVLDVYGSEVSTVGKASVEQLRAHIDSAIGELIDRGLDDVDYSGLLSHVLENGQGTKFGEELANLQRAHTALDGIIADLAEKYGLMSKGNRLENHLTYVYERHSGAEIDAKLQKLWGGKKRIVDTPQGPMWNTDAIQAVKTELENVGIVNWEKPNIPMDRGAFSPRQPLSANTRKVIGYRPEFTLRRSIGANRASNNLATGYQLYHIANNEALSATSATERLTHSAASTGRQKLVDGRYVSPYTKAYINRITTPQYGSQGDIWQWMVRHWKSNKVTSLPFHVRNALFGNPLQMYLGEGVLPTRAAKEYAFIHSDAGKKWLDGELIQDGLPIAPWALEGESWADLPGSSKSFYLKHPNLEKIDKAWAKTPGGKLESAGKSLFEHNEAAYKKVIYRIERQRQTVELSKRGLTFDDLTPAEQAQYRSEAIQAAENAIFDYGDRPQWLDWLSKNTGSFGTYQYKMAGLLGRTAASHPSRIAIVGRLAQLTSPWVDWTYYLPFVDMVSEAQYGGGGFKGAVAASTGMFPIVDFINTVQGQTGRGFSVMNDKDPWQVQAQDYWTALYRFIAPSYAPPAGTTKGGSWYEQIVANTGYWDAKKNKWIEGKPTARNLLKPLGINVAGKRTPADKTWARRREGKKPKNAFSLDSF